MRLTKSIAVAAVAAQCAAIGGVAVAAPTASAATVRHFEGTVLSVDRTARTFRLRDVERGTVRVTVTRNTRYERVAGLAGLHTGLTRIEVVVWRSATRGWVATEVERSGGGGQHGGGADDNGGESGGGGGSGRGGHDDGPNHS